MAKEKQYTTKMSINAFNAGIIVIPRDVLDALKVDGGATVTITFYQADGA